MNKYLLSVLLLLILYISIIAQFKMPNYVHRMSHLAIAKDEANRLKIPITFVLTNENTTCSLCKSASLRLVAEMNNYTVVVYVNSKLEWDVIPKIVKRIFNEPQSGKYIPIAVIVDSRMQRVLDIIPYAESSKHIKLIAKAKEKIIHF